MPEPADRFAIAVVRAWIEPGRPNTLKVRIMQGPDEVGRDRTIGVASDADGAAEIVRQWLLGFALDHAAETPADVTNDA